MLLFEVLRFTDDNTVKRAWCVKAFTVKLYRFLFCCVVAKGGNFVPDVTKRHFCVIKYECQDELNLGYWRESYMKVLQTKANLCILLSRFFCMAV